MVYLILSISIVWVDQFAHKVSAFLRIFASNMHMDLAGLWQLDLFILGYPICIRTQAWVESGTFQVWPLCSEHSAFRSVDQCVFQCFASKLQSILALALNCVVHFRVIMAYFSDNEVWLVPNLAPFLGLNTIAQTRNFLLSNLAPFSGNWDRFCSLSLTKSNPTHFKIF